LNDIVRIIREELNIPIKVSYKSSRGFDVPENILDNTRLREATNWKAVIDIVEGMRRVCEWIKLSTYSTD
jgi:nucleoside-diphosphate-sugar epimerase